MTHFGGAHTGRRQCDAIYKIIKLYEIRDRVFGMTADNASNNETAMEEIAEKLTRFLDYQWTEPTHYFRCAAHVTHLAATDFFNAFLKRKTKKREDGAEEEVEIRTLSTDAVLEKAIRKIRLIATRLHRSNKKLEALHQSLQKFGIDRRKIPTYCRTRWNTAYDQIAVALAMREAIDHFMAHDKDYRKLTLDNEEWDQVAWLVRQLGPFKEVTLALESASAPISMFIPFMNKLIDGIEYIEGEDRHKPSNVLRNKACKNAKEKLQKYYAKTVENTWYTTAMSKSRP